MRGAQDKYNSGMENQISNLRDLLTTRYDATIKENQIQISPDQLECYVLYNVNEGLAFTAFD